jgi:hypothetical protein
VVVVIDTDADLHGRATRIDGDDAQLRIEAPHERALQAIMRRAAHREERDSEERAQTRPTSSIHSFGGAADDVGSNTATLSTGTGVPSDRTTHTDVPMKGISASETLVRKTCVPIALTRCVRR